MSRISRQSGINVPTIPVQDAGQRVSDIPSGYSTYDSTSQLAGALDTALGLANRITGQFADMRTREINAAERQNYQIERDQAKMERDQQKAEMERLRQEDIANKALAGQAKRDARLKQVEYSKQLASGAISVPDGVTPEEFMFSVFDRDTKDMPDSYKDAYEQTLGPGLLKAVYNRQESDRQQATNKLFGSYGESAIGETNPDTISELQKSLEGVVGDRMTSQQVAAKAWGPALSTAAATGDTATIDAIDKAVGQHIPDMIEMYRARNERTLKRAESDRLGGFMSTADTMIANVRGGTESLANVDSWVKGVREQVGNDSAYNEIVNHVNGQLNAERRRQIAEIDSLAFTNAVQTHIDSVRGPASSGDLIWGDDKQKVTVQLPSGDTKDYTVGELKEFTRINEWQRIESLGLPPEEVVARKEKFLSANGMTDPQWRAELSGVSNLVGLDVQAKDVPKRAIDAYSRFLALSAQSPGLANMHMGDDDRKYMNTVHSFVGMGYSANEAFLIATRKGANWSGGMAISTDDKAIKGLPPIEAEFVRDYATYLGGFGVKGKEDVIAEARKRFKENFRKVGNTYVNVSMNPVAGDQRVNLDSVNTAVTRYYAEQFLTSANDTDGLSITTRDAGAPGQWKIGNVFGAPLGDSPTFTDEDIKAISHELTYEKTNADNARRIKDGQPSSVGSYMRFVGFSIGTNVPAAVNEAQRLATPAPVLNGPDQVLGPADLSALSPDARGVIQMIRRDGMATIAKDIENAKSPPILSRARMFWDEKVAIPSAQDSPERRMAFDRIAAERAVYQNYGRLRVEKPDEFARLLKDAESNPSKYINKDGQPK